MPRRSTRAMLHVGEGRPREAWGDLHAVLRLVRLAAGAGREVAFDACWFDGSTCTQAVGPVLELLGSPTLSADDARTIGRDLEALPPLPDMPSAVAVHRVATASYCTVCAGTSGANRAELFGLTAGDLPWEFRASFDMNLVLRDLNDQYDRIEAAVRLPSRRERASALVRLEDEARAARDWPTSWSGAAARRLQLGTSRAARSGLVGAWFSRSLPLFFKLWLDDSDQIAAQFGLLRVAAALAEYRLRGLGGPDRPYPDTLDALVPAVLPAVPPDPFTGEPPHYERRGDGYLLYSVGTNVSDEGGTNREWLKGEWHDPGELPATSADPADIVVRMPRPQRSILPGP